MQSNAVFPFVVLGVILGFATLVFPASAASPPERPEEQREFWASYDKKDWSAAIDEARKLVEAARAGAEQQPLALANALTLLGNALLNGGDKPGAEASYREALQIIETRSGTASTSSLDPMRGLGYTLALLDRHQEAIPYLERALVLSRRNYGLFDVSQLGLLRQLANSLSHMGKVQDAEKQMLYLRRVGERAYGERDPRLVPILCVIGDWYVETGNTGPGRERYREAMQIVERKLSKDDPAMVDPLRALSRSYVQEVFLITQGYVLVEERASSDFEPSAEIRTINPKYMNTDGERALERAIAILDARPDSKPEELIETLIQLGDWFQLKQQPEKALAHYRRAASLAARIDATAPETAAGLGFPVRIYYPMPPLATRNRQLSAEQADEKFVAVQFTVTHLGNVEDAKVIEQNGSTRQAAEALQAVRASRYRPKFVNGEPVATEGMVNREVFKTRKQQAEDEKQS